MNDGSVGLVVEGLLKVRELHRSYNNEAAVKSLNQAYQIQAALAEKIGGDLIGWKIGCTSKMAQELTNTDEPFYGRMFASTTFDSPATLESKTLFAPIAEPEIAFRLGKELTPRSSPYGKNDVLDAVDAMYLAIEIVDCRYAKGWPIGILPTVADNGVHAAFVVGEEVPDWRTLNRPEIPVVAKIDGNVFTDRTAANVLDDPLNALVWLANSCTSRGQSIKVREIVTTGNTVRDPIFVKPGNTVVATFGDIGSVEVSFV